MPLPSRLQQIVDLFATAPKELRLQVLLDYVDKVPPLPPELQTEGQLERVHECQTPFFVATRVDNGAVEFFFEAPPEAPTTRSYAGVLYEGLNGESVEEVLAVPDDFYLAMGLGETITLLRLRGMAAILRTIKRQVRDKTTAGDRDSSSHGMEGQS